MISIKRFIEQRLTSSASDHEMLQAALETVRLILDGMPLRMVRGPDALFDAFAQSCKTLSNRMDEARAPQDLLAIAGETADRVEAYAARTTEYFREQGEQMQAIVRMLTETLAEFSGRSDASVTRLQDIEKRIERASELDDIKELRSNLQTCLASLREACSEEKKGAKTTAQRLQSQLETAQNRMAAAARAREFDLALQSAAAEIATPAAESYVAVFKLQRAEHIAARFGESVVSEMLGLIGQNLKPVLTPNDRLERWKGASLIAFLSSKSGIQAVRAQLSKAVSAIRQQHINVGSRSALLSVGVDWIVVPQSRYPSLNAVFAEVEAFLAGNTSKNVSWSGVA